MKPSKAKSQIILDFYATWCMPCKRQAPIIDQIEANGAKVKRIDFDANPKLVKKHGVTKLPTYVVIRDGEEVHRTHDARALRFYLNRGV
jgi:thioredoxin 1